MYSGTMINDLIAAVVRAERFVAAISIEDVPVLEIPAGLLEEFSHAGELVVA